MTDQEMLELAAKAAGYDCETKDHSLVSGICPHIPPFHIEMVAQDGTSKEWNPLTDDGDALRLAVDLDIIVTPWDSAGMTITQPPIEGIDVRLAWDETGGDKHAATRRAIVMAAAEIGRDV